MCGKRAAAWKYRPSGIRRALVAARRPRCSSRVRLTVPRMPSGSQSPITLTPAASAGTARYSESRCVAPGRVQRAQHAVVVGRAGQRGEDLLAVDAVATVDPPRQRAERRLAGRRRAAFARTAANRPCRRCTMRSKWTARLRSWSARCAGVMSSASAMKPAHMRGAHVHVVRQRRGAAVAADLGRHHHVGGEVGAQAAVGLGHADRQQAGRAQVGEVLEREARLAVVARRARRELVAAERGGQRDQFALLRPSAAAGCRRCASGSRRAWLLRLRRSAARRNDSSAQR